MRPRTLRARYLIPLNRWVHLGWFMASLLGILAITISILMIYPLLQHLLVPWLNYGVFGFALVCMLAWSVSMFSDKKRFQQQVGLIFEDDWLYMYQVVRKLKIRYDDLKNVTYFPSLLKPNKKDRRAGRAAWILIQTKQRRYLLRIPNYEDSFPQFQKYRVPFQENRKKLPLVLFGLIGTTILSLGIALVPVSLILSLQRFFSNNGFLSRRSELLLPLLGISMLLVPLTPQPLSPTDRLASWIRESEQNGRAPDVRLYCDRLLPGSNTDFVAQCAKFYIFTKDPDVRSYKKAQDLSSDALNRATTISELKAYADLLICASMGLGQQAYSEKIARDYELTERAEMVARGELCRQ